MDLISYQHFIGVQMSDSICDYRRIFTYQCFVAHTTTFEAWPFRPCMASYIPLIAPPVK